MRIVRFDDDRTGILVDSGRSEPVVVDVTRSLPGNGHDWTPLIVAWDGFGGPLAALAKRLAGRPPSAASRPLADVSLQPPLPSPHARIFALGVNFRSHVGAAARAVGAADPIAAGREEPPPAGFFVIPGTVTGPEAEIVRPPSTQKLDYEAEVAVVLAAGGRHLAPEEIRFWGHTGFNDVSVRDPHLGLSRLDEGSLAWGLQKNFDGGNVIGPAVVVGEGHDLASLSIRSRVNGQLRQAGSTAEMIWSFEQAAAYLSRYLTLEPGDILTSGTPAGTAIEQGIDGPYLAAGDVIEVEIEGVGVLRNHVA